MENSLKNKFKEDYEKGLETPSHNIWEKLEAKLDDSENTITSEKSSNVTWLKYAAVMLCLLTLGIIFKYSIQDNSAKNSSTNFTKVEAPVKSENTNQDSIIEVKKNEIQRGQNQKLVETQVLKPTQKVVKTQKVEDKFNKNQKFISNSQKIVRNKKDESQDPDKFIGPKIIKNPIIQKDEKQLIANNSVISPIKKGNIEYVKADELLFGRELQKKREQVANNNQNKIENFSTILVEKITPSSVKIFGITVYSEKEAN